MRRNKGTSASTAVAEPLRHWHFTADQYQQMGDAGILAKDARVELLEGEIYERTPIGSWHNGSLNAMLMFFAGKLADRAVVQVQGSFRLSPNSEPEPDLLVLHFRPDFYRSALAGPEDVLLLMEVADASLGYDRDFKLPLYAAAGIGEVWIVNRTDERTEIYREPRAGRYEQVELRERGSTVTPLAFPDLTIQVAEILG